MRISLHLHSNNDDQHKLLRKIHRKTIFMQNNDDNEDPDSHKTDEEESARETQSGMSAYAFYVRKVIEKYLLYVDPEVNQDEATLGITELVKQAVQVARKVHAVGVQVSDKIRLYQLSPPSLAVERRS